VRSGARKRTWLRRAGASLAAAAVLVAVLLAPGPAAGASVPDGFFGVSAPRAKSSEFARMARGGVGTYRMVLHWRRVQHGGPHAYDWSSADAEIENAAANGIQPLVVFYGSARFAAHDPRTPPLGSAAARRGWKRFVAAAVSRYGPEGEFWQANPALPELSVRAWQVWSEQNAEFFWHGPGPSPRRYARLVRLTDAAVAQIDPTAQVLLGGMFGAPSGADSIRMSSFLRRLYRAGSVRERFDGIAVHPYAKTIPGVARQIEAARAVMIRNGDATKPLWITEIGWSTDGPRGWMLVTNRKGQARKLEAAFRMLVQRRARYGIQAVIWFSWRDFPDRLCRWCGASGLFARAGKPKPAWFRFTRFAGGSP
jgi:polysaccharide biosynthesis protein PslG